MTTQYDFAFDELRAEISFYSPSAVRILDQIKEGYGAQTAYYAAYVLICIRAQQESPSSKPFDQLTSADLRDFTFFAVAKDNEEALSSYRRDHMGSAM